MANFFLEQSRPGDPRAEIRRRLALKDAIASTGWFAECLSGISTGQLEAPPELREKAQVLSQHFKNGVVSLAEFDFKKTGAYVVYLEFKREDGKVHPAVVVHPEIHVAASVNAEETQDKLRQDIINCIYDGANGIENLIKDDVPLMNGAEFAQYIAEATEGKRKLVFR